MGVPPFEPEIETVIRLVGWSIGTVPAKRNVEFLVFTVTQSTSGWVSETKTIVDPPCRTMIGVMSVLKVSPGDKLMIVSIVKPDDVVDGGRVKDVDERPTWGVVAGLAADDEPSIPVLPDREETKDPMPDDNGRTPLVAAVATELDGDTTITSMPTVKVPPPARSPTICTTITPGWASVGTTPERVMVPITEVVIVTQLVGGFVDSRSALMPGRIVIRPVTSTSKT